MVAFILEGFETQGQNAGEQRTTLVAKLFWRRGKKLKEEISVLYPPRMNTCPSYLCVVGENGGPNCASSDINHQHLSNQG
jgi:hypothetical protein